MIPCGPLKEDSRDLYVSDLITHGSCQWNKEEIMKVLPDFVDDILCLRSSKTGVKDSYIWYPTTNGICTAKSGYASAIADQMITPVELSTQSAFNWKRYIWSVQTSSKLQLFLWKAIKGALPTGDNLSKRGMRRNSNCIHCGQVETTEHLFLHCNFAKQIWEQAPITSEFLPDNNTTFSAAVEGSANWITLPPCGITGNLFSWICWNIWTARNHKIFESRRSPPLAAVTRALAGAHEWSLAQASTTPTQRDHKPRTPVKSVPPGTIYHLQHRCGLESGDTSSGARLNLQPVKHPPRHQWIAIP